MDCTFDPNLDEYSDSYNTYRMKPGFTPLEGSWESLAQEAAQWLGSILVQAVKFDPTLRHHIDTEVLKPFVITASGEAG